MIDTIQYSALSRQRASSPLTPPAPTPFIYGGLGWIRGIHRGIAAQIRAHGLDSIEQAVGSGLEWKEL